MRGSLPSSTSITCLWCLCWLQVTRKLLVIHQSAKASRKPHSPVPHTHATVLTAPYILHVLSLLHAQDATTYTRGGASTKLRAKVG